MMSIVFVLLIVFPIVSADIIMQEVDESSGIVIEGNPDVELRNAIVEMNFTDEYWGYLKATFDVYSNEEEIIRTKVYLKAQGQYCYGGSCSPVDIVEETDFRIRNTEPIIMNDEDGGQGIIYVYDFHEDTIPYETGEGIFASSQEFILAPKQITQIEVYQPITTPFEYYLDSLSTFTKADHEKIIIYGDVNVEFNNEYPAKKISNNEWVWEYSNLDVNDENLKDVLIIKKGSSPPPNPEPNNLIYYFLGTVVLVLLILSGFLIKKRR